MSIEIHHECVSDFDDHTDYYQADCDSCGWHTRKAEGGDGKRWVNTMAQLHGVNCPSKNREWWDR